MLAEVRQTLGNVTETKRPAELQQKEPKGRPTINLVNTRVKLRDLSEQLGEPITVGDIPDEEWEQLGKYGDTIWFMGIYKESPEGRRNAKRWAHQYTEALPDIRVNDDVVSSPFAILAYEPDHNVARSWGEWDGMVDKLHGMGKKVFLDLVPNHVSLDHPWATSHPEYFIRGNQWQYQHNPDAYFPVTDQEGSTHYIAHGKDPNFPHWIDTLQLNYAHPKLREEMRDIVLNLVDHADGVRCDMAMLLNPETFIRTWGDHLSYEEQRNLWENEFWPSIIPEAKAKAKINAQKRGEDPQKADFAFIAEAYWDIEKLGNMFDGIYAKGFYDDLQKVIHGEMSHQVLRGHMNHLMSSRREYNPVFFTENHDEQRAARVFGDVKRSMAAAVVTAFLPGGYRLVHEGQQEGRERKIPMQINRRPDEPLSEELASFYERLESIRESDLFQKGNWIESQMRYADNWTAENIIAQQIELENVAGIVACTNLSNNESDVFVNIPINATVQVYDIYSDEWLPLDIIAKPSEEGFYVRLQPWKSQIVCYTTQEEPSITSLPQREYPMAKAA